jgi:hypothetical protein
MPDSAGLVRPKVVDFSADGGNVVTGITWSSWTAIKAVGTGTRVLQNCIPNCAQGKNTPVTETLTLSQPEGGFFTVIVAAWPGQIAETTSGSDTWPLQVSNG